MNFHVAFAIGMIWFCGMSMAGPANEAGLPGFSTPIKGRDFFAVFQGLPSIATERPAFDREQTKPGFSSFGEYFYGKPLPVAPNDLNRIDELLSKAVVSKDAKGALSNVDYPQADYRIVHIENGRGYCIFVYPKLRAVYLRAPGSSRPLDIEPRHLDDLLRLLRNYRVDPSYFQ